MSDQTPQNGGLFNAEVIAEAESAQWVATQLQQTVRDIRSETAELALQEVFVGRFKRYHTQRRWFGIGLFSGSGIGGLALGADTFFDIEWAELFNGAFDWLAKPLVLKLTQVGSVWLNTII